MTINVEVIVVGCIFFWRSDSRLCRDMRLCQLSALRHNSFGLGGCSQRPTGRPSNVTFPLSMRRCAGRQADVGRDRQQRTEYNICKMMFKGGGSGRQVFRSQASSADNHVNERGG